jgi:hypothetical protein
MKPDKQRLLNELLDGEPGSHRTATLLAGGRILRRRRHWRAAVRVGSCVLVLAVAGFWLKPANPTKPTSAVPLQASVAPKEPGPEVLTDDQLLALFPNTPVALAPLADGKKRLIFPRPEDERKFVIRL